jgi:ABC-type Fe3+ transport system permease subunit
MEERRREDSSGQRFAEQDHRRRWGLTRYARTALIAGSLVAVVCVALLVIIFALDSFNATIYSVGGKDVRDDTEEARAIRDSYSAARLGGIIFLIAGAGLAAAAALLLYRGRNDPGRNDPGRNNGTEDGEDVEFDELAGP